MCLRAKSALSDMRLTIGVTRRAVIPALRFAGFPEELLEKFSQRSHQRDRAIEEFVAKNGRQPTDNEVAVLVRESRADKLPRFRPVSCGKGNGQG